MVLDISNRSPIQNSDEPQFLSKASLRGKKAAMLGSSGIGLFSNSFLCISDHLITITLCYSPVSLSVIAVKTFDPCGSTATEQHSQTIFGIMLPKFDKAWIVKL